jgi:hypothetical protein
MDLRSGEDCTRVTNTGSARASMAWLRALAAAHPDQLDLRKETAAGHESRRLFHPDAK